MSTQRAPVLFGASTPEELREAAVWLQVDAAYLYRAADVYRDAPASRWVATQVQENAAHSSALSRAAIAKATGSAS